MVAPDRATNAHHAAKWLNLISHDVRAIWGRQRAIGNHSSQRGRDAVEHIDDD